MQTKLTHRSLILLALTGLLGALCIGLAGIFVVSPLLIPLVIAGALLVPAYNLEVAGGRFHSDTWFALSWGGFPAFTGYFVNALSIRPAGIAVTAACVLLSRAQRQLSTPARQLRRQTAVVRGEQQLTDGRVLPLTSTTIAAPLEGALSSVWLALVLLAAGLVAVRV